MARRYRLFAASIVVVLATIAAAALPQLRPSQTSDFDAIAARVDPDVAKQRVIVLTDIANGPDDQMSMVRFLVYANEFDVEGLVAGTSTWMSTRVRPDVINTLIDAYEQVEPSLRKHAAGFPDAASLRRVVASSQTGFGMQDTDGHGYTTDTNGHGWTLIDTGSDAGSCYRSAA